MILDFSKKLDTLLEDNPEILDFLLLNGFMELKNPKMIKLLGQRMTLEKACTLKKNRTIKPSRKI